MEPVTRYPEHEKLAAVRDERSVVQDFLDWVYDKQVWRIAEWRPDREIDHELVPIRKNREELMAEYFQIDLAALDREKRDMVERLRGLNAGQEGAKEGVNG